MAEKHLWGNLENIATVRTPKEILSEQASHLYIATGYKLQGQIRERSSGSKFLVSLDIVAPALDNYSYEVLRAIYDLDVYPVNVRDVANGKDYEVKNEKEFLDVIEKILSSPEVHKVISVLISQSTTT